MSKTIAAIATAYGNSGINIIRISGDKAIEIADSIFVSKNKGFRLKDAKSHTIHYGTICDEALVIDEVLVSVMKAPNTYTKEDVVEINCHGGVVVTNKILELCFAKGASIAKPGEFTERAFLNGRIDLSQAEAVIDIINAKNKYALNSAVNQLRGSISEKIKELREKVLYNIAFIESVLDDPEHLSFEKYDEKIQADMLYVKTEIEKLLKSSGNGRLISEGIKTVILGKPNAGKSSFLNALIGEERAIVTDIEGTTRDTLEENINIDGINLIIVDTAGIRETTDIIEQMGIEKAINAAEMADLIIYIVDASSHLDENDKKILDIIRDKKTIILINKMDLEEKNEMISEELSTYAKDVAKIDISAKEIKGFDIFMNKIKEMFFGGELRYNDEVYITNLRQKENLSKALSSIDMVIGAINDHMPEDFYSIDLSTAYEELGFIIGESVEDDLVDKIFREFCTGK